MKKIYYSLLSVLLLFTSCDWLDINTDPKKAVTVNPDVLYNYAMIGWAGNRCSGDLYYPLGWMAQTLATGGDEGWGNMNVYDIDSYPLGNTWKSFYPSGGANLKEAIKIADQTGKVNASAQCKIALVQLLYSGTTLHGDIPYSEAFQEETYPYPHFDSQKDILESLIKLLDEAVAQIVIGQSETALVAYDLAYKGDMNKWIRYANSLKFRIAILMVDKDPSKGALIKSLLEEDKMINSADGNFEIPFEATPINNTNPKYRLLANNTGGPNLWFFANKSVVDPLNERKDPRISRYFDKGNNPALNPNGEYIGAETNSNESKYGKEAMISAYMWRADAPELFFSYQEQLLLEAEVYARGSGVTVDLGKAGDLYKAAIRVAMEYYEVPEADITSYFTDNFKALSTYPDPVKEIFIQQWIDLMEHPLEAFTAWRRSVNYDGVGTPVLTVPEFASPDQLPYRWQYSPGETTANPNTPEVDRITDKPWFMK